MVAINALIVDPQPFFCEALAGAMAQTPGVRVAGWTTDELEADRIVSSEPVDLVLTELNLRAGSGLSLARRLRDRAKVMILTRMHEGDVLLDAVAAGAVGCLSHEVGLDRLREMAAVGASGAFAVDPERLRAALLRVHAVRTGDPASAGRLAVLTAREREILGLVASGLDDEAIAAELYLSPKTVRTHVGNVLKKLGVHTRADAARLAIAAGDSSRAGPHVLRIEGPRLERG